MREFLEGLETVLRLDRFRKFELVREFLEGLETCDDGERYQTLYAVREFLEGLETMACFSSRRTDQGCESS